MSVATRRSPVHEALAYLEPEWGEMNSMPVALSLGDTGEERVRLERGALCDVSALDRFGVKGPSASGWLRELGFEVPEGINTWSGLQNGGFVIRLGTSEFLVEDGPEGSAAQELKSSLNSGTEGLYPVLRQDAAFALIGSRAREVMLQCCALDFDSVDYGERPVFLTRIALIPALVLPREVAGTLRFRLWCEYPYGMYLWGELSSIVEELGGGPVGVSPTFRR